MPSIFQRQKPLSELEDEREHEEAEVSLLKQRVMRKQLEEKMGKGGMRYFKDKNGVPVWKRIENWLKTY